MLFDRVNRFNALKTPSKVGPILIPKMTSLTLRIQQVGGPQHIVGPRLCGGSELLFVNFRNNPRKKGWGYLLRISRVSCSTARNLTFASSFGFFMGANQRTASVPFRAATEG